MLVVMVMPMMALRIGATSFSPERRQPSTFACRRMKGHRSMRPSA
jgi:hypothetical protein